MVSQNLFGLGNESKRRGNPRNGIAGVSIILDIMIVRGDTRKIGKIHHFQVG